MISGQLCMLSLRCGCCRHDMTVLWSGRLSTHTATSDANYIIIGGKPTIRLHRLVLSRLAWGSQMSCNTSQVSLTLYVVAKCLGDGVTQNFTYNVADKVHICTCVCTNSLSMKVPLSLVALDVS